MRRFTLAIIVLFGCLLTVMLSSGSAQVAEGDPLKVLFLGDQRSHRPRERFDIVEQPLAARGVELEYTERVDDLRLDKLQEYDVLLLYANIDRIAPEQAEALLEYVNQGGGFAPIHCASYCFRNSDEVVALIGGQFRRHGTGVFGTELAQQEHPIMQGFGGFESWDETYEHHLHNEQNRTVLSYRVDGSQREPWTWVRTHGEGRVFYTAWGHDERTWGHAGFQNLLERGLRWAAGQDPGVVPAYSAASDSDSPGEEAAAAQTPAQINVATTLTAAQVPAAQTALASMANQTGPFPVPEMTTLPTDEPFEFEEVGPKIPNYVRSNQWGRQGDPRTVMQKPLPPEESIKRLVTPQGFHVEMFASEPELGGKPIAMAWDERGRLWIAETVDYPNNLQTEGGHDRIRICEDTDGDWRADKFTVFAEDLSIPTSLTFYRGGVIVHNGTETIYLKDTDGDDRADERRVLFGTWNQRDTHGGPSNMQYGLDNWIWGMQGYNDSTIETPNNTARFRQGFLRFKPDGSDIEFLRSTSNNTWGMGISEEGIVFGSTANDCPSVYMPIPNRYYERVEGWAPDQVLRMISDSSRFEPITDKVRQVDQFGKYTAGAGHAVYTARTYPQEYWNRTAFVCGPTGHLVGTFVLTRDGADFHSTSPFNLLAGDDEWSAPIMAEVGPDGNVWVIDWYNYIVQHNPTPRGFETGRGNAYESDLRDKTHGRIYRVVYDAGGPFEPFSLADASPAELVETLTHDNLLWRKHAQRLLVERGELDVVDDLIALAGDQSLDAIGLNPGAIHALWTLHGLGALDGSNDEATAAAVAALRHPSPGVRRNAVQVLPVSQESLEAIVTADLTQDADPQVRLAALLAISDQQAQLQTAAQAPEDETADADGAATDPVAAAILQVLEDNPDRWLREAATSAAATNAGAFLLAAAAEDNQAPSAALLDSVEIVAQHFARSRPETSDVTSLIATLESADPSLAGRIARGLEAGWPAGSTLAMSDATNQLFRRLVERLPAEDKGRLVTLAVRLGSQEMSVYRDERIASLLDQMGQDTLSDQQRIAAAQEAVALQPENDQTTERVLGTLTPTLSPELANRLLGTLAIATSDRLGEMLVGKIDSLSPSGRAVAIGVMLNRASAGEALLEALEAGTIRIDELSLLQRRSLAEHPNRFLRRRATTFLRRGEALPSPDRQQVLQEYAAAAERTGDIAAGQAVFKKTCAACHRYQGEGEAVGPDLTGMSVHPKEELLVHILDPNRSVESNFRSYTVVHGGLITSGMLAGESATALELVDAEGKRHQVLREDVEELIASNQSVMPEGFEKQHTVAELADLLEFLAQPNRFVPLDLRKVATASSAKGLLQLEGGPEQQIVLEDWSTKTVDGVPFYPVDPREGRVNNVVLLNGSAGQLSREMPRTVELVCNTAARAIHLLSGVSVGGYPQSPAGTESLIVRLHYADGTTEEHPLANGVHFADFRQQVDVPQSARALAAGDAQMRYLKIEPERQAVIERIELDKGGDPTAPLVMAVTVERL